QDDFMERHDPAGPELADQRTQRPRRILEIHQHESAHDRIKALVRLERLHIRSGKAAVAQPLLSGPCRRALDCILGAIDAEHASGWSDQPGCEKETSPGPQPTSSTRIPMPMPARRKISSVSSPQKADCIAKRRSSVSQWPRT